MLNSFSFLQLQYITVFVCSLGFILESINDIQSIWSLTSLTSPEIIDFFFSLLHVSLLASFLCAPTTDMLCRRVFKTVTGPNKLPVNHRSVEALDFWRSSELLWLLGSLHLQLLYKASFHFLALEALSRWCFLREVEGQGKVSSEMPSSSSLHNLCEDERICAWK